ncbi:MAG: hypothetical protein GC154_14120 [bacterium]|nr:hypothetical protein [bacterium]
MNEDKRKYVWELKLRAEYNVLYWSRLAGLISFRDRCLRIIIAVVSSGTVASWLVADYPLLWKVCSSVTALLSIVLSIINWPDSLQKIASVRSQWIEISNVSEKLWLNIDSYLETGMLDNELDSVGEILVKAQKEEFLLPMKESLRERCYNTIRKKHEKQVE